METVAVIPARGGSKGIQGKNTIPLCGKPLIAWTIEAALKVSEINRVIVSTDCSEIKQVAELYGAEVVSRPDALSGDTAASELALLHVLDHLKNTESYSPDIILFLQCTSPLTLPKDIEGTLQSLVKNNADCVFTATASHQFLWKAHKSDGAISGVNHDMNSRQMRQERTAEYIETGAVYALKVPGFKRAQHRFFGKIGIHLVPKARALEIDEHIDLELAQILMSTMIKNQSNELVPKNPEAIVLDFDGVLTDNKVLVMEDGKEAVNCNRSDGLALSILKTRGIPMVVISTEKNKVVKARCSKLGVECYHGIDDKLLLMQEWAKENNVNLANAIYVGNDINDEKCLQHVGHPIVVGDAAPEVKRIAKVVLQSNGGNGAIRELFGILQSNGMMKSE